MQSAVVCPSCRHAGPFESDVCPKCSESLSRVCPESVPAVTSKDGAHAISLIPRSIIEAHFAQGQKAWPGVRLPLEVFLTKIRDIASKNSDESLKQQGHLQKQSSVSLHERLRWLELFLTTACANGDEAAWQIFEGQYRPVIQTAARCCASNPSEATELADSLFSELFLPAGGKSGDNKIGQYHGMGSLEGWLRVVVSRMAIDRIRRLQKQVPIDDLNVEPSDSAPSPRQAKTEQDIDRQRAISWCAASFDQALAKLHSQDKLLLKLYYLEGLNLKEIAVMLRAHESTASRALERIRKQVRKSVEKHLKERFRVRSAEIPHLLELAQEGLTMDIREVLTE